MTIKEFYNIYGQQGKDITYLCDYANNKDFSNLMDTTADFSRIMIETPNGITVYGDKGAYSKEFADNTPMNEVIDYLIEEMRKNNESMSKFDKSVEIAKIQIVKHFNEESIYAVVLPINTEDLINDLGGDWYYNLLLSAGYSATTAKRKWLNYDYDKLVSKLDPWYQTELRPKLYNRFINENRTIITLE